MAAETSILEIIPRLEDQTWQVLSRDGKDLMPFLSEDCIMQFPFGMSISAGTEPSIKEVMSSEAFVPWRSYRMSEVVVTPIGSDGAVISYRVKASRGEANGKEDPFRALICSVWRKELLGDVWKMCFHQQTPFDHGIEDIVDEETQ